MQLLVRKVASRSASKRQTRKQRGGDSWDSVYTAVAGEADRVGIAEERKAKWMIEFKKPENNTLFGLIFTAITEENKAGRLEQWLNTIMYQEKLFDIAFKLHKENISAEYFADVVRIINFRYMSVPNKGPKSKINLLINAAQTSTDESLLTTETLGYFKEAFSNSFITSLASIINMIKLNSSQLTEVSSTALSRYFASITKANAWLLTGYDLKDGFFLDQGQSEFTQYLGGNIFTFYSNFLKNLKKFKDSTELKNTVNDVLVSSVSTPTDTWNILTAVVAATHIKGEVHTILTYFTTLREDTDDNLFGDFQSVPDKDLMNIELSNNINVYQTMKALVRGKVGDQHMQGDGFLHFILHLAKRCVELENPAVFKETSFTDFFTGPAA